MEKLRLYYPCKPYNVFQSFAECHPSVCDIYKKMGLRGHNGEDVACPSHTKLYAAHDGVVVYAGEDGSNGYLVVIRTKDMYAYKGKPTYFKTLYAHLEKDGIQVKAGQEVSTGDFIAYSGNTGISTGPHLHFGLKPTYPGEEEWQWFNLEGQNGFLGAISPDWYWTGIHAQDVPGEIQRLKKLVAGLAERLAQLLKQ